MAPNGAIGDWASVLHYRSERGSAGLVAVRSTQSGAAGRAKRGSQTSPARSSSFEEFTFFTVFQPIFELQSGGPWVTRPSPAGYDTLARMESLKPAFLKLGRASLAGIETEGARRASIRSLVDFARQHGCTVIAEGLESAQQRDALVACGVPLGQGFYLGRPVPVERALADAASR